jgi:hypothetical protein
MAMLSDQKRVCKKQIHPAFDENAVVTHLEHTDTYTTASLLRAVLSP